jgi:hypothetical protein
MPVSNTYLRHLVVVPLKTPLLEPCYYIIDLCVRQEPNLLVTDHPQDPAGSIRRALWVIRFWGGNKALAFPENRDGTVIAKISAAT